MAVKKEENSITIKLVLGKIISFILVILLYRYALAYEIYFTNLWLIDGSNFTISIVIELLLLMLLLYGKTKIICRKKELNATQIKK